MKLLPIILFVLLFSYFVYAETDAGDIKLFGLELEKLLSLFNGLLSTFLFIIALVAYKRDGRTKLLYVSVAFLLFAVKSFLVSSELFIPEIEYLGPIAIILEVFVLLSFFFGVLKK